MKRQETVQYSHVQQQCIVGYIGPGFATGWKNITDKTFFDMKINNNIV